MASQEEPKEKPKENEKPQEKDDEMIAQQKLLEKKKEEEMRRKEIEDNNKKFENKLMKYFGNEFFERRLEIPPKDQYLILMKSMKNSTK